MPLLDYRREDMANHDLESFVLTDCNPELGIALKAIESEITIKPDTSDRTINEWIAWLEDSSFDISILWNEIKSLIDQQLSLDNQVKNELIQLLSESREFSIGELLVNSTGATHELIQEFISALLSDAKQNSNMIAASGGGKALKYIDHHPGIDTFVVGGGLVLGLVIGMSCRGRRPAEIRENLAPAENRENLIPAERIVVPADHRGRLAGNVMKYDGGRIDNLIDKAHASGGQTLAKIDVNNKDNPDLSHNMRRDDLKANKANMINQYGGYKKRSDPSKGVKWNREFTTNLSYARQRYLAENTDNVIHLNESGKSVISESDRLFYGPYDYYYESASCEIAKSNKDVDTALKGISKNGIKIEPIVKIQQGNEGPSDVMMIRKNDRYFIRVNYHGRKLMMYKSSGVTGKVTWPKEKWYIADGWGRDGWINKDGNSFANLGDSDLDDIGNQVNEKLDAFRKIPNDDDHARFFEKPITDKHTIASYFKAANAYCTPQEEKNSRIISPKMLYGLDCNGTHYDQDGHVIPRFNEASKISFNKYFKIHYPGLNPQIPKSSIDITNPHQLTSYRLDDLVLIRQLDFNKINHDNPGNYFEHLSTYCNSPGKKPHLAMPNSSIQHERATNRKKVLDNKQYKFQVINNEIVSPDSDGERFKDWKWRSVIEHSPVHVLKDLRYQLSENIKIQARIKDGQLDDEKPNYIEKDYLKLPNEEEINDHNLESRKDEIIRRLKIVNESRFQGFRKELTEAIDFLNNNHNSAKAKELSKIKDKLEPLGKFTEKDLDTIERIIETHHDEDEVIINDEKSLQLAQHAEQPGIHEFRPQLLGDTALRQRGHSGIVSEEGRELSQFTTDMKIDTSKTMSKLENKADSVTNSVEDISDDAENGLDI